MLTGLSFAARISMRAILVVTVAKWAASRQRSDLQLGPLSQLSPTRARPFGRRHVDARRIRRRSARMMMDQTEQLSEVISAIYDAVLDRSLWNGVLGKVAHFAGGSAAILFSTSTDGGNATVFYESGTDPQYRHLDFNKYLQCSRHN